jgi:hypothetical protein
MVTKKQMREPDPLAGLTFVANGGKGHPRNFWNVTSTGDYAKDCELGRQYAKAALLHMLMEDEPHLLTDIVLGMIENFQHFPREEWEMSFLVNAKGIIIALANTRPCRSRKTVEHDDDLVESPEQVADGFSRSAVLVLEQRVFPQRWKFLAITQMFELGLQRGQTPAYRHTGPCVPGGNREPGGTATHTCYTAVTTYKFPPINESAPSFLAAVYRSSIVSARVSVATACKTRVKAIMNTRECDVILPSAKRPALFHLYS